MNSPNLRLQATPEGVPTLEYACADGHWIPLHSRYRPREEARRWVRGLNLGGCGHLTLVGLGLGYQAAETLRHYGQTLRRLTVVEAVPEIVELAQRENPAALPWDHPSLEVLTAPDPATLYRLQSERLASFLVEGYGFASLPWVTQRGLALDRGYLEELSRIEMDRLRAERHMREQGPQIQDHLIANLPAIVQAKRISTLKNRFASVPAFVIGAGPSFDRNFEALRNATGRGLLLCADTIAARLQTEGIQPHLVAAKDAHLQNLSHLRAIPEPQSTALAFDPQLHPHSAEIAFAERFLIPNRCHRIHECFPSLRLHREDRLPAGQTAVHAAFSLAVRMGCDPIVLVGVDLAFPRAGGNSHATGTALATQIDIGDTMHYHGDEARGIAETVDGEVAWIPGVDGQPVPTSPGFVEALRRLDTLIDESGRRVIDATEGGARIGGTEIAPLHDVVASLPQSGYPVGPDFVSWAGLSRTDAPTSESWRREIPPVVESLQRAAEIAASLRCDLARETTPPRDIREKVLRWRTDLRGPGGPGALFEAFLEVYEIAALRLDGLVSPEGDTLRGYSTYCTAFETAVERYKPILEELAG